MSDITAGDVRAYVRDNLFDGSEGGRVTFNAASFISEIVSAIGFLLEDRGLIEEAYSWHCAEYGHQWYRSVSAPPDTCLKCGAEEDHG